MIQRGRKSINALMTPVELSKLIAPPELSKKQKQFFDEIVNSLPADYFSPADGPLLAAYCAAADHYREALQTVNQQGQILETDAGKQYAHPAIKLFQSHCATMALLAQKLKLNPAARGVNGHNRPGAPPPWDTDTQPGEGLAN